ncbi:MAG TPA: ABC transporter substrate-binding protein [Chloroflexota bacterium]|jgi:ABC-type nitrate/sulfonate/bicarbonate transport system substrate-binding protein
MATDRISATGYQVQPGFVAAQHLGYFADEGLEVAFEVATHAPTHNRGMAEGRWDLTLSSADTMIARVTRDGADYVLFLNAERGLDAKLIGAPDVTTLQHIRGRTIAGDPGDSNYDLHRRKILRDHGIAEDQYGIEIVGSSPARAEALLAGRVAAAMLTPAHYSRALEQGFHVLADAADHVPEYPVCSGWTRRAWAESHRDTLVRFIRAFARGSDWALDHANRAQAQELFGGETGMAPEHTAAALARVMPHAAIDPAGLARVAALRAEMGFYDPPYVPIERFYDAGYWTAATGLAAPAPVGVPTISAPAAASAGACGCAVRRA